MDWYIELYSENAGNKTLSSENGNLPDNWRDFAIQYIRSEKYSGVFRSVTTDNISFIKDGKTFLDEIIEDYGVTEVVRVLIWHKVANDEFSVFYNGKLDLTTYESDDIFFKCKLIDSDYVQKFRSREDIEIDINSNKTLDGNTIPSHIWKTAILTARGIDITGYNSCIESDGEQDDNSIIVMSNAQDNKNPSLIDNGSEYFYNAVIANEDVECDFSGAIDVAQTGTPRTIDVKVYVAHYNGGGVVQSSNNIYSTTFNTATDRINFTGSTASFSLVKGDQLRFYVRLTVGVVPSSTATFTYARNQIDGVIRTIQTSESSDITFDLPFPLFDRMLRLMTSKGSTLDSTILGSTLDGYTSNGAAWNYGITNGYLIRQIEKYPVFKFSDLFGTYSKLFNIGLGFEDDNGKKIARIEEKEYFYQRTTVITLDKITDFKRTYADNYVYNAISVGYENQEYNEYGGQTEFNQQLEFSDKLQTKAVLDLISPFRADGLGIELQRRLRSDDDDSDADANNFIIDLKDDGGYTNRTAADAGITNVDDVPVPDTVYNITISPRHNLLRWGNWLRSGLNKFKTEDVNFTGSEKDITLTYTEDSENITEAADIEITDFNRPIFEPEIYSFTCPLTAAQVNTIESNPNGIIKFSYYGVNYYGFLNEMTIKIENKTATFELLKAYKYTD